MCFGKVLARRSLFIDITNATKYHHAQFWRQIPPIRMILIYRKKNARVFLAQYPCGKIRRKNAYYGAPASLSICISHHFNISSHFIMSEYQEKESDSTTMYPLEMKVVANPSGAP